MESKNTWNIYNASQLKEAERFAAEYRHFLDGGKTERECIDLIVNEIEDCGYKELSSLTAENKKLKKGDKVYSVQMNKAIVMYHIGSSPVSDGMNILGAHIDSPRIDIKQNPLFEDGGYALLDTHYYGGFKKYQWVAIPLAIHGVVVKKDGTTIELNIGENEDDPVFFISDLLVHLAQEQMKKTADKVIEGEAMDIIVGNRPLKITSKNTKGNDPDKEKDPVVRGILDILKKDYDIEEEDFVSAELEVVPAGNARESGFDRSMILGYGQDDRVCAFGSYKAMLEIKDIPERTTCCLLVDKEEVDSVGATGMHSHFFENATAELLELMGKSGDLALRRTLAHSAMLSSDVSSAFDPSFASAFEKKNVAYLGNGMVINKYTGVHGKRASNDANAEYIACIRSIFDKEKINFQTAELGKVDLGGGGTIAYIMAQYGMNVIDSGVPVLSMHSPWECTSKVDIYETKRGYVAFLKDCRM